MTKADLMKEFKQVQTVQRSGVRSLRLALPGWLGNFKTWRCFTWKNYFY